MKNKRVMVTGGAGFIGSHLAEDLAENNEVTIIDDISTGKIENLKELKKRKKAAKVIENIQRDLNIALMKNFKKVLSKQGYAPYPYTS